jgi:putative inorganic carbon (hco3(-)) transporter
MTTLQRSTIGERDTGPRRFVPIADACHLPPAAQWRALTPDPSPLTPDLWPGEVRADLLVVCLAGYILTAVGRVHQLFPALEVLRPAILTGLFAIALYALDRDPVRRLSHVLLPPMKWMGALLVWMVLSVPGALVVGTSFTVVFDNFIKTALMSLIIAASIRNVRDVERLAFTYFLGAVIYSAVVITRFDLGTGDAWRLGRLYYYDANDFATFVVSAVPLGVYLLHAGRTTVLRAGAAAGLIVLTLGIVWSGSRGGFIALSAVGLFIVLRYSIIPVRWRLWATALVAVVLLSTASDQYWQQMSTITSHDDYNRTSESGRLQIWARGLGYMMSNPVLGLGPGNFQAAEGTLSPYADRQQYGIGVRWNAAHNSFIQAGAELGLVGLVLFVGVIASTFAALRRAGGSERGRPAGRLRESSLTPALTAALLGFVVGSFFLSLAYSEMLYTLVALAVGLQKATDVSAT